MPRKTNVGKVPGLDLDLGPKRICIATRCAVESRRAGIHKSDRAWRLGGSLGDCGVRQQGPNKSALYRLYALNPASFVILSFIRFHFPARVRSNLRLMQSLKNSGCTKMSKTNVAIPRLLTASRTWGWNFYSSIVFRIVAVRSSANICDVHIFSMVMLSHPQTHAS